MLKGSPHPETVFFTVLGMTIVLGFCHALAMGDALTPLFPCGRSSRFLA